MHGTSLAPLEAGQAGIAHKLLAFMLSAVLALSLTPIHAFADAADQVASGVADGAASDAGDSFADAREEHLGSSSDAGSAELVQDAPSASAEDDEFFDDPFGFFDDDPFEIDDADWDVAPTSDADPAAGSTAASDASQARVDAAVAALDGLSFYKVKPRYGIDSNINDVLEAKLAELGFADVEAHTAKAEASMADAAFTAGISDASDDTNGAITYASYDPGAFSSWALASYRSFSLEFVLTHNGAEAHWKQSGNTVLDWDEQACVRLLEPYAEGVAVGFAAGDDADAVTADMVLPYKAKSSDGSVLSWSSVVWESSDDSVVEIVRDGYQDYRAQVARGVSDKPVTLTAKVSIVTSGGPQAYIERAFPITVKGDAAAAEAEKQQLHAKLDAAFSADTLTYSVDGSSVDASALTGDFQLPTPRAIGVDGKYYAVSYVSDSDAVSVNGYRGNVYRGLPGNASAPVKLTASIVSKSNPDVSVEKTIDVAVAPLDAAAIDAEAALMDEAVAGYAEALLNGQASDAVQGDLHAFKKAYRAADGSIAWSYSVADKTGDGIVPVELPGASEAAGYRLFESSVPSCVHNENLTVERPSYNTDVTVRARLSSEKFARYADRYANDPVWGEKFASLAARDVSARFTVLGTSGAENPKVSATLSVIGMDADGAAQTWAAAQTYTLDTGATAADLSEAAFAATGLQADTGTGAYGWFLNTITSPFDGRTLGFDQATGKFWQLFVNGKASEVGAGSVTLSPGDSVVWSYSASGETPPSEEISVSGAVYGADAAGKRETWAPSTNLTLKRGATAADLSDALFAQAGLTADTGTGAYGWFLNTITSPFDGRVLGWDESTGAYWQLFVNGEYSQLGAGSVVLQPGDTVTWVYGSDEQQTPEGKVSATIEVVGEDANGVPERWATPARFELDEGATAADLSEAAFAAAGLQADTGTGAYGWFLNTITSPFDGRVLGYDAATGKYWCLYVNGVQSELGAGSVELHEGDAVSWCYTTYGADLPDADDVVIDPDASRPDYESEHPMFAGSSQGGNVTNAPTPTTGTQLNWSYEFGEGLKGGSDPLIVNGNLYVVAGSTLRIIDAETGSELRSASIGAQAGYFCRPAYVDGLVVVPREDGSLAAFTADTLTCVWISDALDALDTHAGNQYQALSTLTANGHYLYAGFTMAGSLGASFDLSVAGALVCIDVNDGRVVWTKVSDSAHTGQAAGYYWAGAAASGDDIVIGDESGTVSLVDGADGSVLSSVSGLGGAVRAGVVSLPDNDDAFLAVSRENGTLHMIAREGDALTLEGSVPFAAESTSTPAVVGATAFVCGVDEQGYGTISAIDLKSMTVRSSARAGYGKAQAAPLVSVTNGKTYAYFTCNGQPGGVYAYCLEDDALTQIYVPDEAHRQYSTSTVIADVRGNLYYANDSGVLFSLAGAASWKVSFDSLGGSPVSAVYVAKGQAAPRPADPTREGYAFAGWYADEALTRLWDFATAPSADMTLFAAWARAEDGQASAPDARPEIQENGVSGSNRTPAGVARTVLTAKTVLSPTGAAPALAASEAAEGQAGRPHAVASATPYAAEATAAGDAAGDAGSAGGSPMPWWPFVGLALGACGLVAAFAWGSKLKKENGK